MSGRVKETANKAQAGQRSSAPAPEAAKSAKERKRKAQGAASVPAAPAGDPAGTDVAQPAKRRKAKAAAAYRQPDGIVGQHSQQAAAAEPPSSAAQKRKAPLVAEEKASKKAHTTTGNKAVSVPADGSTGLDSQPAHMHTAQQSGSVEHGMAGALNGKGSGDGNSSADEADVAAQAARTATGADAARPKLTEEQRQERLQRTVFVGNLPAAVKAKRLKQAFSRWAKLSLQSPGMTVALNAWCHNAIAVLSEPKKI